MPIVKTGPSRAKRAFRGKQKCWDCGATDSVFAISPATGHPLCMKCGERYVDGIIEPVKRAKKTKS